MNARILWILLLLLPLIGKGQSPTTENYIPYRKGTKWGLCNEAGAIIVPPGYREISFYNPTIKGYVVEKNGLYGLINARNEFLIPAVSIKWITGNEKIILVYTREDSIDFYSTRTYKKMYTKAVAQPTEAGPMMISSSSKEPPAEDEAYHRVLKAFINDGRYTITASKDVFMIYQSTPEEKRKRKLIGIYLPERQQKLMADKDIEYTDAKWEAPNRQYLVAFKRKNLYGLMDEQGKIIIPAENDWINLNDDHCILYRKETNGNYEYHTYIPKTNRILDGEYRFSRSTRATDGKDFLLFCRSWYDKQSNFLNETIKSEYAGENGTVYFED